MDTGHLGGWTPGGDEATWYPDLWRWLVEAHGAASVVDVGCGDALAADFFCELGCRVVGVDGDQAAVDAVTARWHAEGGERDRPTFVRHDYAAGPLTLSEGLLPSGPGEPDRFDLAWCCEFVEHVDEAHAPNFLATLAQADLVLLTHAFPGQGGHHHVNCRLPDYWVGAMAAVGYQLDGALTDRARIIAGINRSPWNHFVRSGLAFRPAARIS